MDWNVIKEYYEKVKNGAVDRLDISVGSNKLSIYRVGSIIRIDIKEQTL